MEFPGFGRGLHHDSNDSVVSGLVVDDTGVAVDEVIGLLRDNAPDFLAFLVETVQTWTADVRRVVVDVDEQIEFRAFLLQGEHTLLTDDLRCLVLVSLVLDVGK